MTDDNNNNDCNYNRQRRGICSRRLLPLLKLLQQLSLVFLCFSLPPQKTTVLTTTMAFAFQPSMPTTTTTCTTITRIATGTSRSTFPIRATSSPSEDEEVLSSLSCDVAVFGGGFGGLYTALQLDKLAKQNNRNKKSSPLNIVLVDPSESFCFLPLLYDLTVGTATVQEVCPTYRDLLSSSSSSSLGGGGGSDTASSIRHVQARLESLDPITRKAQLTTTTTTTKAIKNNGNNNKLLELSFDAAVIAVGATPQSLLEQIPGAKERAQPFYTQDDAMKTKTLLERLEREQPEKQQQTQSVAVVGGGYGGVELAACVQRRLPSSTVSLLTRGPPMEGTRAAPWVGLALEQLGVDIIQLQKGESVVELKGVAAGDADDDGDDGSTKNDGVVGPCCVVISSSEDSNTEGGTTNDDTIMATTKTTEYKFDAVLWTAGSGPASPVRGEGLEAFAKTAASGRLSVDDTLRCLPINGDNGTLLPAVWALGDCAETPPKSASSALLPTPKTAQAAMQQANVVASNVLAYMRPSSSSIAATSASSPSSFAFQDLGSLLTLGGPNAAVLAPQPGSLLAPLLAPVLEAADQALGTADKVLLAASTTAKKKNGGSSGKDSGDVLVPSPFDLGLSLSSHGLLGGNAKPTTTKTSSGDDGNKNDNNKDSITGSLAGTLSGAARRAVYAARMPTSKQQAVSAVSAFFSTATALAQELERQRNDKNDVSKK